MQKYKFGKTQTKELKTLGLFRSYLNNELWTWHIKINQRTLDLYKWSEHVPFELIGHYLNTKILQYYIQWHCWKYYDGGRTGGCDNTFVTKINDEIIHDCRDKFKKYRCITTHIITPMFTYKFCAWDIYGRYPGARPTDDISIEFEIRAIFALLWFQIYSTDHNKILLTSRQCNCRDVWKFHCDH